MEMTRIHTKIAEADFFLRKMTERERQLFGDREHFDYYLSAFLNAGRTIDWRLRHEQPSTYPQWRNRWNQRNPSEDKRMEFMHGDRAEEVHASGSSRSVAQEGIEFGIGTHHIEGATIMIAGPPDMPPAVTYKPTYNFTIDGVERKVIEACAAYLASLQRLLAEFEADHP
jgi:hypothetical protein